MNDPRMDTESCPKFLADQTAGKLARWLRILGLDVDYIAACEPERILKQARRTGRKVITRNKEVARKFPTGVILLESSKLHSQIKQILNLVGRGWIDPFSRCNICNAKLIEVEKQKVRGRVPEYVFNTHDEFSMCPVCGRYYWQGTHGQKMQEQLTKVMEGREDEISTDRDRND